RTVAAIASAPAPPARRRTTRSRPPGAPAARRAARETERRRAFPRPYPSARVCASLVGLLEALQQLVAACHDRVQCFLGRLLAAPHVLEFFVLDGADLHVVAKT